MNHTIHVHHYTMHSKSALNAKSRRCEHPGSLIRVQSDDGIGYGCIHPWPELGDVHLEQTINMLRQGEYTALSLRSLFCAKVDAVARRDGLSLFDGMEIPRSHATLEMEEGSVSAAVEAGFDKVKLKAGRDISREIDFIRDHSSRFPDLRWRLDFNHALDDQAVGLFLNDLGEETRAKIDFIEDAYQPQSRPRVNAVGPFDISMAVDREVESARGEFRVAVIKPAVNQPEPILESALQQAKRVVLTSYMDHPLGQSFAAWEAARAYRQFPDIVDTCGLITHGLFEENEFTEALGLPGPDFHPPQGTGLGFDQLLEDLPWKSLR